MIPPPARLAQFRREWPRTVRWSEVRARDPEAFRAARTGALLLGLAAILTAPMLCVMFGLPFVMSLPRWLEWTLAPITVILVWTSIALCIWGAIMLTMPSDTRRGIAIAAFAEARGMYYSRVGVAPWREGILFAEGRIRSRRLPRRRGDNALNAAPLFYANHALRGSSSRARPLQIAIATYRGEKSDPRGPRHTFRYLEMPLPRRLPHLMLDSRSNGRLSHLLPGVQRLSLEGDFDRYFSTYVPHGYERDALQLLTPDVMACLIDHGRQWDIEVIEDRLVVASRRCRPASDRTEYTAMLYFSELIELELGHQANHYTDSRAAQPKVQVAPAGTRLRLRSAAWGTGAVVLGFCMVVGLPHLLGWLLDR